MKKIIDVPRNGPAVPRCPDMPQEHASGGMRIVALPPGEIDLFMMADVFSIEVIPGRALPLIDLTVAGRRNRTPLVPRSLGWIPPGVDYRVRCNNPDWELVIEFTLETLLDFTAETETERSLPGEFLFWQDAPRAAVLAEMALHHLRFEIRDPLLIEGLATAILAEGRRTHTAGATRASDIGTEPRIARAIDYIEAHLGDDLSVAEIAGVASMSPSWFQSAFRAVMGRPVFAYVRERRLERARILLADRRLSLSQIAFACGFSSHSHMSRLFRARFGVSPKDLR